MMIEKMKNKEMDSALGSIFGSFESMTESDLVTNETFAYPALLEGVKIYATKYSGWAYTFRNERTIAGNVGYDTKFQAILAGNEFAKKLKK